MFKRSLRLVPVLGLMATIAVVTPLHAKGSSAAVKKLKGMVGQLAGVKGFVEPEDARLTQLKEAVTKVAEQDDADAAKTLLVLLRVPTQSASVEVALSESAREGLLAMKSKPAHDVVRKALSKGKKRPDIAASLAEIVGSWSEPASATALAELLKSKHEAVVLAGARGLSKIRVKQAIGPLVEAFGTWEKRGGEPLEAIGDALWEITQLGLKTHADWAKWWKSAQSDWTPAKRDANKGGTRPRSFQKKAPVFYESLEVKSKKLVIIMDTSGSMHIREYVKEKVKEGKENKGGGTSLAGGGPKLPAGDPTKDGYKKKKCTFNQCPGARGSDPRGCPSDENLPTYYQRMDRLARATKQLVDALGPRVKFNMVAYSTAARSWKGTKLLSATASNKDKAKKWLSSLQPSGSTGSNIALELAFKFKDADTFIFVTDGAPTNKAGKTYPAERWRELLDEVKRMNKVRKVRIDVIAIRDGHTAFATDLAEENRGQYLSVD